MEQIDGSVVELAGLLPGDTIDYDAIETAVEKILEAIGEDSSREGVRSTPERVARMFGELMDGYRMDPIALVNGAIFDEVWIIDSRCHPAFLSGIFSLKFP